MTSRAQPPVSPGRGPPNRMSIAANLAEHVAQGVALGWSVRSRHTPPPAGLGAAPDGEVSIAASATSRSMAGMMIGRVVADVDDHRDRLLPLREVPDERRIPSGYLRRVRSRRRRRAVRTASGRAVADLDWRARRRLGLASPTPRRTSTHQSRMRTEMLEPIRLSEHSFCRLRA